MTQAVTIQLLLQGAGVGLPAYLLGSVPFAIVVSRLMRLPDPRQFGSGNPGATNVLRSGSKVGAFLTLVGDAGKGAAAVLIARLWAVPALGLPPEAAAVAGLAAFGGHLYPVFLGFKGGKGVATFLGTLLALSPIVGVATCLLWLVMALLLRYSSLASLICAAGAALALMGVPASASLRVAVSAMALLVIWRHRENIVRLIQGRESRIGAGKQA
jgi:glycerol-3-phosphate acyltransferase PlsY